MFRLTDIASVSASSGWSYIVFSTPHHFKTGDSVAVNVDPLNNLLLENISEKFSRLEVDGEIERFDNYSIRFSNNLSTTSANLNTSVVITDSITEKKRENNLVTLQLDGVHRFVNGDSITVENIGTAWNGNFVITDAAPNGNNTRIRYSQNGPDEINYISDTGKVSTTVSQTTTSRYMTNNIVRLSFSSGQRYIAGDTIIVNASSPWINGTHLINNNASTYIEYSTAISNIAIYYSEAFGWTRPRYIDVQANGFSNIVYPELPQIYSVSVSPTSSLSVGTSLTATTTYNTAYRYAPSSDLFYQWVRADTNTTNGSLINNANSQSYTLTDSDLNKYISCRVTAINDKGSTIMSSNVVYFSGPLPAPTNLSISSIATNSVTFGWNAVTGATGGYEYAYGNTSSPTNWTTTTSTSVNISGLVANTAYTFRVRAKKDSSDTNGTIASTSANTLMAAPIISSRTNVATENNFGKIILTNTPQAGGGAVSPSLSSPVYIKMQYKTATGNWTDLLNSSGSALTQSYIFYFIAIEYIIPISGTGSVTSGVDYFFRSAIVDSSGNFLSPYSSSTTTAVRCFNPPPAPTIISTSSSSDGTSLTVTWNTSISSDSPVLGWAVSRLEINLDRAIQWSKYTNASTNSHTFTNLNPNTSYTVKVKALIGTVASSPGTQQEENRPIDYATVFSVNYASQTATTANVPATPTRPTTTTNSTTKITVSWSAPANGGSSITEYHTQRSTDGINWPADTTYNAWGATTSSFDAVQVDGNTDYYFRVRARNGVGNSAWSASSLAGKRVKLSPTLSIGTSSANGFLVNHTNIDTTNFSYSATLSNTNASISTVAGETLSNNPFKVVLARSVTATISGGLLGLTNIPAGDPIPRFQTGSTTQRSTVTVSDTGHTATVSNPSSTVTVTATFKTAEPDITDGSTTSASGSGSALTVTKSYQWQRADTDGGTPTNITGATSQTYTTSSADNTKWLRCRITYSATGATSDNLWSRWKKVA
jgi:hypothetical protein